MHLAAIAEDLHFVTNSLEQLPAHRSCWSLYRQLMFHLLHYEADQLCVEKPDQRQLDQLQIRCTYVDTENSAYKEHFGARKHKCGCHSTFQQAERTCSLCFRSTLRGILSCLRSLAFRCTVDLQTPQRIFVST